jgi:hypothetical protein
MDGSATPGSLPLGQCSALSVCDRDGSYDEEFHQAAERLGIHEVRTAPRSPWQNAYVERLIGSIRRECLDHVIVLHESGLRRILKSYFAYYECSRTHLSLAKDTPNHTCPATTRTRPSHRTPGGRWTSPSLRTASCLSGFPLLFIYSAANLPNVSSRGITMGPGDSSCDLGPDSDFIASSPLEKIFFLFRYDRVIGRDSARAAVNR